MSVQVSTLRLWRIFYFFNGGILSLYHITHCLYYLLLRAWLSAGKVRLSYSGSAREFQAKSVHSGFRDDSQAKPDWTWMSDPGKTGRFSPDFFLALQWELPAVPGSHLSGVGEGQVCMRHYFKDRFEGYRGVLWALPLACAPWAIKAVKWITGNYCMLDSFLVVLWSTRDCKLGFPDSRFFGSRRKISRIGKFQIPIGKSGNALFMLFY